MFHISSLVRPAPHPLNFFFTIYYFLSSPSLLSISFLLELAHYVQFSKKGKKKKKSHKPRHPPLPSLHAQQSRRATSHCSPVLDTPPFRPSDPRFFFLLHYKIYVFFSNLFRMPAAKSQILHDDSVCNNTLARRHHFPTGLTTAAFLLPCSAILLFPNACCF